MIFLALRIILFLSATILLSAQETTTAVTLGPMEKRPSLPRFSIRRAGAIFSGSPCRSCRAIHHLPENRRRSRVVSRLWSIPF